MQSARDAFPQDPEVLEAFAHLASTVGRYDEAIDALEIASHTPGAKSGAYEARLEQLRYARESQQQRRILEGR